MNGRDPNNLRTPKTASQGTKETRKKASQEKRGNVFLSGLKNFGIVFVLCLVIFGIIASLAVTFVTSAVDDIFEEKNQLEEILNKESEEAAASGDGEPLPDGESFTVFIAVTDYDPAHYYYYPYGADLSDLMKRSGDRTMGVLSLGYKAVTTKLNAIVRFDKEKREYTVTPVSSHTKVFTPSGYLKLGEVYSVLGPEYLVRKVEAITGIGIDYFMFFDALESPDIATALGAFNVELSKDIYSDGAAFGTADKVYGDVTSVTPPETIPAETKKNDKDKKKTADTGEDTEKETTASPVVLPEVTTDDEKPDKEEREFYHLVVSAGTVTVHAGNVRALLMFDDYESGSVDERLELEYQLVRGALLRLASMSDDERIAFYDKYMLETPVEDCAVNVVSKEEQKDNGENADDDNKENDQSSSGDEDESVPEPAGYAVLTDKRINTDISRKTAQLKGEMVSAAMRFNVSHLEFKGRFVNGYYIADFTGNASRFMPYKLPDDPEKFVTAKNS